MKPVHQTIFGEKKGNCLQACLSSIFGVPIYSFPHFQSEKSGWYEAFSQHMIERFGLQPVELEISDSPGWLWIPKGYHLVNGKSPRGDFYHSVVGKNGNIVHDPHPDGTGLKTRESFTVFVKVLKD